ncbi:glycosyltransferase [Polaribacter sp. 20A6]|uniref:glycosyltransferase n=1 Tax=Polaribacter sp. 20A6 TaxID=2687289 RepID=UPI0013FE09ED|nr:glycosyltransferase [Polaribacter sp. 20A6]
MQIHATNINGLGASQVVISFLDAFEKSINSNKTIIHLPNSGILADYEPKKGTIKRFHRKLPNALSRLFECFFSRLFFANIPTIVLGDIPLRGIKNQIVLVHQPNLIYPKINSFSSTSITFRVNRFLFKINHKYAKKIIVQTGAMAKDMIASYPSIKDKIIISPQPVPNWLSQDKIVKIKNNDKIVLFYPAAFYLHKKHNFLLKINNYIKENNIDVSSFEILLTLTKEEFAPLKGVKFLKNLGRLNAEEMNNYYRKVDALLFLSSMESYGLPLVEALTINLPIVTVKFDYATWLCEDLAYYFKPYEEKSFLSAIGNLRNDLKNNKLINYDKALKKFPVSWKEVVSVYEHALNN